MALHYTSYNHTLDDNTIMEVDHECNKNKGFRLEEAWMTVMDSLWPKYLNGGLQTKWNHNYTLVQQVGLCGLEWHLCEMTQRKVHLDKGTRQTVIGTPTPNWNFFAKCYTK